MNRRLAVLTIASAILAAGLLVLFTAPTSVSAQAMQGMSMPQPTAAEKKTLMELHKQMESFKSGLVRAGKYACCIQDGCNFCASAAAMCPCGDKVSKGEAVCGECKMGWQAGLGRVKNVNAASVKGLDDMMSKMMMDARAMQIQAGKGGKGR